MDDVREAVTIDGGILAGHDGSECAQDAVLDMWNEAAPAVHGFVGGVGDGTGRPAPEPRCP